MIEPSQTLCSCTTQCLKDCIFQQFQNDVRERDSGGLGYCKLGCAISMCSGFSTRHAPNGEKVDGCVGSCSNKCVKSYSLPQNNGPKFRECIRRLL
ncbi:Thionin-like protein 2 [Striga hermonthica]|uniref:Thionin-like protein 2 n=1 Tax=Striga hermonthica TaxID=68872 RepID=A0A9N7RPJ2_STRHE|nr:Thionin-like protein 2 [Striga hermonthica]